MAFSIKNDEADRLVRELTAVTGESLTTAVIESVRERLERARRERWLTRAERSDAIVQRFRELPVLDDRSPDDIVGYDECGLPS